MSDQNNDLPGDGEIEGPDPEEVKRKLEIQQVLEDRFIPWFETNIGEGLLAKFDDMSGRLAAFQQEIAQELSKIPELVRRTAAAEVEAKFEGVTVHAVAAPAPAEKDVAQTLVDAGADPSQVAVQTAPAGDGSMTPKEMFVMGLEGAKEIATMVLEFKKVGAAPITQTFAAAAQQDPLLAGYIAAQYVPRDAVEDGLQQRLAGMIADATMRTHGETLKTMAPAMRAAARAEVDGPVNPTESPPTSSPDVSRGDAARSNVATPALLAIANGTA